MADYSVVKRSLLLLSGFLAGAAWLVWAGPAYPHDPITTDVLFNREVVRIFERKCVQCHSTNTLSMPLMSYREARPWAQAIKEEVLERRMPPWPAVSGYGAFANENSLTPREIEYLVSWVDGGVPAGPEAPGAPPPDRPEWPHGTPDTVLEMPSHPVPPDAKDEAIRIVVPTGLSGAQWIRSLDFRPGDRRVVKSAFFYNADSGQWLGGWTPWHAVAFFPENVGVLLPANARIAVEVHYHGGETPVSDRSAIGLHFAGVRTAHAAADLVLRSDQRPAAGPNRAPARLHSRAEVPDDLYGFAMRVELNASGRSVEVTALKPDGSAEILLWENPYRPEWPTPYLFREPVFLPRGTVVVATAYFDPTTSSPGASLFSRVTLSCYPGDKARRTP